MKRTLSLFLAVLLLLSACFSGSVYADIDPDYKPPEKPKEEYSYSIENSEVVLMYYCSYSAEFKIPETMEGYPVTKVEFGNAFVDDFMKTLYIPKTVRDVGTSINYGNRGLQAIVVDEENPYYSSVDGVLYNKDKTELVQYPAAKQGAVTFAPTVEKIGDSAFYQCSGVTAITIPEGVTTIGDCAFWANKNLTSVELPNSLTAIGFRAFGGCTALRAVRIPDGVKTIDSGTFKACHSLQSVEFPDGLTHICERAFFDCKKLNAVILPKGLVEIGTEAFGFIDYSSYDCLYWKANPDFTIYGWKNTAASQYAGWVEVDDGYDYLPVLSKFNFVPLDYFTDTENPPLAGDMSANGALDAEDALIVLKNVVGKHPFHQSQMSVADMDGDGKVAATDALEILRNVVGKIPEDSNERSDDFSYKRV